MKPSLQIRLSQHLALTPQLQQSIRLLQLSTLELHQEVGQMLEQNPFLEAEEEAAPSPYDTPPERQAADRVAEPEAPSDGGDNASEMRAEEFGTTERSDWENGTEGDDFDGIRETPGISGSGSSGGDGDEMEAQDHRAGSASLQDHLRAQALGMRLSADDSAALHVLIESLNGDGYLADSLDEIAEGLAAMFESYSADSRAELVERLRCALAWLQSLEPTGVGARSLGECLTLQLRNTPRCPARQLAMRICEQYLELLARRDMKRLVSLTGADENLIRQAQALIVACEPKPGRPFAPAEGNVIVPDVIVRKTARGLAVALNPDVMPKLRINDLYAQAVRGQRGANGSGAGLSSRLQEARWFVKNIQ
ncbi:MAG: RNA polymerase factor sigma-54, partial [Chitinophagaceae bacterium]|nr:RNA polymerase factor sigma-54 [Rubrivivax sp.]